MGGYPADRSRIGEQKASNREQKQGRTVTVTVQEQITTEEGLSNRNFRTET